MTSWQVSRHPEWDMMYLAGLTVREIADLCHENVATIHLHLKVREKYFPGLRVKHERALEGRGPDRPSTRWRRRLSEVLDFQTAYGRLPSSTTIDGGERLLARWVAVQRNSYHRGDMSAAKVLLLDNLSAWEISEHQRCLDENWRSTLSAVVLFVDETGGMPRYKNYSTEHERVLGVWLHRQHQQRAENKLRKWRLDALNAAIPQWRSRS